MLVLPPHLIIEFKETLIGHLLVGFDRHFAEDICLVGGVLDFSRGGVADSREDCGGLLG